MNKTPFQGFLLTSWFFFNVWAVCTLSTLPRTNSLPLKLGYPKRKQPSSNHEYSGINSLLVSGRKIWFHLPKPHNENHLNSGWRAKFNSTVLRMSLMAFFVVAKTHESSDKINTAVGNTPNFDGIYQQTLWFSMAMLVENRYLLNFTLNVYSSF